MININIELPDSLHTKLKLAAALHDSSLKEYIANVLQDARGVQPTPFASTQQEK